MAGSGGERGAGGVQEAGIEGKGSGIPKVAESGRNRGKRYNITLCLAIRKAQRGGNQQK